MKVRKGDTVKVITGKDRGKIGKVVITFPKQNRLIVEKVNIVKKHKRESRNQKDSQGIIEIENPIDISNVQVICSSCNKPSRIGIKIVNKKKKRYCKKCNEYLE